MQTTTAPRSNTLNKTFEMDGKAYRTDAETLAVLRDVVPAAKASCDTTALFAVMHFGKLAGRIVEFGA